MRETHFLKILPEFFEEVKEGRKNFAIRTMDRDFNVGEAVVLREYDPVLQSFTGRFIHKTIVYLITYKDFPDGICKDYCVFGME